MDDNIKSVIKSGQLMPKGYDYVEKDGTIIYRVSFGKRGMRTAWKKNGVLYRSLYEAYCGIGR